MLNKNGPEIDPCGTPKRNSNRELRVESSLTLWKQFEK